MLSLGDNEQIYRKYKIHIKSTTHIQTILQLLNWFLKRHGKLDFTTQLAPQTYNGLVLCNEIQKLTQLRISHRVAQKNKFLQIHIKSFLFNVHNAIYATTMLTGCFWDADKSLWTCGEYTRVIISVYFLSCEMTNVKKELILQRTLSSSWQEYKDCSVQDCSIYIASALQILQFCSKLSIYITC